MSIVGTFELVLLLLALVIALELGARRLGMPPAAAFVRMGESAEVHAPRRAGHFRAVLAATKAGRTELIRLHRTGEIHDSVLHELERELDLEEMRFSTYAET